MTDKIIEKHIGKWTPILKHLFYDARLDETFKKLGNFTPGPDYMFRAFRECPPKEVKLVIFGQDPHSQKGVADGLTFSCSRKNIEKESLKILKNAIYQEGIHDFEHRDWEVTDLTYLAKQGVLLLNTALTCKIGHPGSHIEVWDWFIKEVLEAIQHMNLQYILYGNKAQDLEPNIIGTIHKGYHPIDDKHEFKTLFMDTNLKLDWLPNTDTYDPTHYELMI